MPSGAQVTCQVTVTTLEVAEERRVGLHLRAKGHTSQQIICLGR